MARPTKKKQQKEYLVIFGNWTYTPIHYEILPKYEMAMDYALDLTKSYNQVKTFEFFNDDMGETVALITDGWIYAEIQEKIVGMTFDQRMAKLATDKLKPNEMREKFRLQLENFAEENMAAPEDKEPKHIVDHHLYTYYKIDKEKNRVRIPTHERKKMFMVRYPNGLIREIILKLDEKKKSAIGEGRVYTNKEHTGIVPSELKDIPQEVILAMLQSGVFKMDHPAGIGQSYENYEELEKSWKRSANVENGGQHYPEAARTAAVGSALTNAGIPEYLDEIVVIDEILVLDQTNRNVRMEVLKFDKDGKRKGINKLRK